MSTQIARKILVVEDDNATRRGLVALLRNAGYNVVAVNSIPDAKKALVTERPDLLITDVRLGAFNGLQLLATNPNPIPAIVMTGFPDRVLEAEAQHLGAEFVLKPVVPSELMAMVERKLSDATKIEIFHPARRWERKRLASELPAQVDQAAVRIVDVSYGGMRFAADRAPGVAPESTFQISIPSAAVSLNVRVVWQRAKDDAGWVCGAMITDEGLAAWREVVDRTAEA
jgi:DNA-binding response OmpR family regulator